MDEQDRRLVDAAGAPGGDVRADADYRRAFAELLVNLKAALLNEQQVATKLTKRIEQLIIWLLHRSHLRTYCGPRMAQHSGLSGVGLMAVMPL